MQPSAPTSQTPTVAELVNHLFEVFQHSDGRPYTLAEVGTTLRGKNGPSHLSQIRSGGIKNPTRETLLALCLFFNISPLYFFPELEGKEFRSVPPLPRGRRNKPA